MKGKINMTIKFKKLSQDATIPTYGSSEAIGMDLYASVDIKIYPQSRELVATDIACEIPDGTYLRIAPRSGLAMKFGIDVLAGVIDPDYRGALGVILQNNGDDLFTIKKGDRIAQAILEEAVRANIIEVDDISDTDRGEGGFGSTGVSNQ